MGLTKPAALAAALIALGGLSLATPAAADRGGCPPGLQKKHNGCRPPGQAKKDPWQRERAYHRWHAGERIGGRDYVILRDYRRYRLPPPPDGTIYVVSGGHLLRVDPNTLMVLGIVGLMNTLLR
jgi:Ni/Co efflux regulator RcnB